MAWNCTQKFRDLSEKMDMNLQYLVTYDVCSARMRALFMVSGAPHAHIWHAQI